MVRSAARRVSNHEDTRSSGPRASVSCPGRVKRARLRERNETRDARARHDGTFQLSVDCAVKLLGPGSRFARPGHERAKSRRAKRTVGRQSQLTMSNSAVFFVPAARCCARVWLVLVHRVRSPCEGWAERRQAHLSLVVAFARRRRPRSVEAAARPMTRDARLSALHRGDFRLRTHDAVSRQWHRSRSDCPRQASMPGGRGPDLPTLRFAPQPQDATPRSAFQDRLRKTPLHERGWQIIYYKFVT